tara:strand:+ start:4962 stop:5417 length:456 start_codon:yes stop_codon:yes gene_type:complete
MIHIFDLDDTLLLSNSYNKYTDIIPNEILNRLLENIERKYIFTNGTYGHAVNSLYYMRLPLFNYIFARDNLYLNQKIKPYIDPYIYIIKSIYNNPNNHNHNIVFYDDMLENLKTAKKLNWITVWIKDNYDNIPDYVDYHFDNIIDALLFFR